MEFTLKGNKNYAATVVHVQKVEAIPGSDNIHHAIVWGNRVIVGKDVGPGDKMIYFPVECQLSHEFVSFNNLYRKPEFGNVNRDAKPGFFDETRRIRTLRLRGAKSEGFLAPLSFIDYLGIEKYPDVAIEFDSLDDKQICCKYIPRRNPGRQYEAQVAKRKIQDRIVDGQFRFHSDTENLRRNIHQINPDDVIDLSWKIHGTSAVYSNILVERDLKWYEKLVKWAGVQIKTSKYGFVWSSRKVVKGIDGIAKEGATHYYGSDVWGHVAKEVEPVLPKGYTVYGEIVGYTPEGAAIQSMGGKAYDYGCDVGKHRFDVYRVTVTNEDGEVLELPAPQMREWCKERGLSHVPNIWTGIARDLCDINDYYPVEEWRDRLLSRLEADYVYDQDSKFCANKVPEEGIVLRIDGIDRCRSWKLKSFKFLEGESKQLDTGVADIETEESGEVE
jgi:hypothetical protein